jgi:hypothetical protein
MPRDRIELIPQRLRIDDEPLTGHHAHLAFERQMIRVLRHGHADAKFRRIAAPGNHLRGSGRCDDRPVARAAILLPDVMLDLIREPDDRDAV